MNIAMRITTAIVLTGPVFVIAYDIFVLEFFGRAATITAAVQRMASQFQELPWIVGGLFTWLWLHLFATVVLDRFVKGG